MQGLKEYWQNMSSKTKKMLMAIVAGTVAIAIVGLGVLALGNKATIARCLQG